jgi:hypothetical protein
MKPAISKALRRFHASFHPHSSEKTPNMFWSVSAISTGLERRIDHWILESFPPGMPGCSAAPFRRCRYGRRAGRFVRWSGVVIPGNPPGQEAACRDQITITTTIGDPALAKRVRRGFGPDGRLWLTSRKRRRGGMTRMGDGVIGAAAA